MWPVFVGEPYGTRVLRVVTIFSLFTLGSSDAPLVIAKGNGLSLYDLSSSKWNDVYYGDSVPYSVDYLTTSDGSTRLFWSDIKHYKINSAILVNETLTNVTSLRVNDVGKIENLAVDWVSGNVYWVVTSPGRIDVAGTDGSRRSTVVSYIAKPRALALDPEVGFMFWSDLNEVSPCIERSSLSGNDRRAIKTFSPSVRSDRKSGWINAIALDRKNKHIFWVDAKSSTIETSLYDGSGHRILIEDASRLVQPFGLVFASNSLFWSDLSLMAIVRANLKNVSSSALSIVFESAQPVFGFKSLDTIQPRGDYHCGFSACSHLCLRDLNGNHRCLCPFGMTLAENKSTCVVPSAMLLVVSSMNTSSPNNSPAIFTRVPAQISNESLFPPIILNKYSRVVSISYDFSRRLFVWLDAIDYKVHFHAEKKSGSFAVSPDSTSVTVSSSGDVFISEAGANPCISLCSLSSGVCVPLIFETLNYPTDLNLVDSHLVWLESSSSVQIYSLTNKTRSVLYSDVNMCCATVDPLTQFIYWMSGKRIARMRLDGGDIWSLTISNLDQNSTLEAVVDGIAYFNRSRKGLMPFNLTSNKWLPNPLASAEERVVAVSSALLEKPFLTKSSTTDNRKLDFTRKTTETYADDGNEAPALSSSVSSGCSLHCFNFGVCVHLDDGFETCLCPLFFGGRQCELQLPKQSQGEEESLECGCVNGVCSLYGNDLICDCYVGYEGTHCERDICADYCVRGNCSVVNNFPRCSCSTGWIGKRCNEPSARVECKEDDCTDKRNRNSRFHAAIFVCVPVVLCLLTITIALSILLMKTRRLLHTVVSDLDHEIVSPATRSPPDPSRQTWRGSIFSPALMSLPLYKPKKNNEDEKFLLGQNATLTNTHV